MPLTSDRWKKWLVDQIPHVLLWVALETQQNKIKFTKTLRKHPWEKIGREPLNVDCLQMITQFKEGLKEGRLRLEMSLPAVKSNEGSAKMSGNP